MNYENDADYKKENLGAYIASRAPSAANRYLKTPSSNLVGNTFTVGRKIGAGNFGELHLGKNVFTNDPVAIKLELTKAKTPQLVFESGYYNMLNPTEGIPIAYFYGQYNRYNALVIELLGPNLEELFESCGRKFTVKTATMIAIQAVKRIESVHKKHLIYRDIKPENFLIGRQTLRDTKMIYLVDFGLAKRYINPDTNLHIPFKDHKSLTGTARYMSISTHLGLEQSRRDDLEAIGYMIMYFLRGSLPWQGLKADTLKERYQKIGETKQKTPIEELCKNSPSQLISYFKYVRSLGFLTTPDYSYLYELLLAILEEKRLVCDWDFDWLSRKSVKPRISPSTEVIEKQEDDENYARARPGASVQVLTSAADLLDLAADVENEDQEENKCSWCCSLFRRKPD